jgi:hypothetical protein
MVNAQLLPSLSTGPLADMLGVDAVMFGARALDGSQPVSWIVGSHAYAGVIPEMRMKEVRLPAIPGPGFSTIGPTTILEPDDERRLAFLRDLIGQAKREVAA